VQTRSVVVTALVLAALIAALSILSERTKSQDREIATLKDKLSSAYIEQSKTARTLEDTAKQFDRLKRAIGMLPKDCQELLKKILKGLEEKEGPDGQGPGKEFIPIPGNK